VKKNELQSLTAAALSASPNQVLTQAAVDALTNIQKRYFRSIYLDNAFSYEGDVSGSSIGNISNVLYDGKLYVNSAALPIVGKSGFINFQVLPVGVEAGYNVSASTTTGSSVSSNNYSIARLVNGAIFSLLYQPQEKPDSSPNVSLDLGIVNRYLFTKELYYNQTTKQTTFTNSGDRYYAEANLKVLLGAIGPGRPGVQVGFQRGWLPPAYAFTKMFTVSLIYQTSDDNTSKDIKLVNKQ
jgi:hypothetical protein